MLVEQDLGKEAIPKQKENFSKLNDYQKEEELTRKEVKEMRDKIRDQEEEIKEMRAKLEDQKEVEEKLDKASKDQKRVEEMMAEVTNII